MSPLARISIHARDPAPNGRFAFTSPLCGAVLSMSIVLPQISTPAVECAGLSGRLGGTSKVFGLVGTACPKPWALKSQRVECSRQRNGDARLDSPLNSCTVAQETGKFRRNSHQFRTGTVTALWPKPVLLPSKQARSVPNVNKDRASVAKRRETNSTICWLKGENG